MLSSCKIRKKWCFNTLGVNCNPWCGHDTVCLLKPTWGYDGDVTRCGEELERSCSWYKSVVIFVETFRACLSWGCRWTRGESWSAYLMMSGKNISKLMAIATTTVVVSNASITVPRYDWKLQVHYEWELIDGQQRLTTLSMFKFIEEKVEAK